MKNLIKKLKNKKGFTLMEMLIVVAIMVILVAVSIPVFTSQLGNARKATDDANIRAAKSVMLTQYMTGTLADDEMYYDAENGVLLTDSDGIEPYGQGSTDNMIGTDSKDKILKLTIDSDTGVVTAVWQ